MLYAAFLGFRILKHWDINSSSATQLSLERRTYLVSTIAGFMFGFEILSVLLYIYTVDDLHINFVGAMCATGSLNANPVGWWVLFTKIAIFFAASIWLALNHTDQQAEDYPLVKIKYRLLIAIIPLIILDSWLQMQYFLGLKPDIITSCCGALFSNESDSVAGSLIGLPILFSMFCFYGLSLVFIISIILSFWSGLMRFVTTIIAPLFFLVSIGAIISFVSLYYYEIPTHHCPFDLLQKGDYFIGYPLYISLFGGTVFAFLPGITEPLRKVSSLSNLLPQKQKRWLIAALFLTILFVILCSWPILFSDFTLEGYL